MPESVTDRCTQAHEYLLLLSKSHRDHFDVHAISEVGTTSARRQRRSVWSVVAKTYPDAHFATFPEELVEPCVLAGLRRGGTVLDPFLGSGTTAFVASSLSRDPVGIDLNAEFADIARAKLGKTFPLFLNQTAESDLVVLALVPRVKQPWKESQRRAWGRLATVRCRLWTRSGPTITNRPHTARPLGKEIGARGEVRNRAPPQVQVNRLLCGNTAAL